MNYLGGIGHVIASRTSSSLANHTDGTDAPSICALCNSKIALLNAFFALHRNCALRLWSFLIVVGFEQEFIVLF